ncbi:glutathione peroxidase [Anaeromicropila populeti]|uniref:Glutathione peroxidase n=1 Tax=Anaeromicropila populeti TaxID=37658 RepID=A0A1I6LD36_9FIRM|nr:glutathione peroxidase [Anaeromicropila populeti]SFS01150.1 glutathione peroxidase [Anaeromicropila populeti]
MNVYDFIVKDKDDNEFSLKEYEGMVLLIMNSATGCGFTPQYDELQDLYEKYADQGFAILDFPCNQFENQAPGSTEEIITFCSTKFGITFPIFSKINVKGDDAEPLFQYLTEQKGFEGFSSDHQLTPLLEQIVSKKDPDYAGKADIKWNFTKFLINRKGEVIARFEPTEYMYVIEEKIKETL